MPIRLSLSAVLLASLAFAASAGAAVGPGPRLAFVEWVAKPPMTRLVTKAVDAPGRRTLELGGVQPVPFAGPAWTPDGSALVFAGFPVDADGEARENARSRLFAVGSEGGIPRELPGTEGAVRPVLGPDGLTVAFERLKIYNRYDPKQPLKSGLRVSSTAWTTSLDGGRPRRLTPWRNGVMSAPQAFSPDGTTLLMERDRGPGFETEVVSRPLSGGPVRVIAVAAEQPAYSPDGSRIALVSYRDGLTVATTDGPEPVGELYVVAADGSQPRRLTRTRTEQESQPSWSPSGLRLAFLRTPAPAGLGFGATVMQANADGRCARRVFGNGGRFGPGLYGPVWQPGAGREATVLPC